MNNLSSSCETSQRQDLATRLESATFSRRGFLGSIAGLGMMSLLAGCSGNTDTDAGSAATGTSGETGTLTYYISNPTAIDPYNCQETMGSQVVSQLFDGLTTYDFENGKLVCAACENYEENDDATPSL